MDAADQLAELGDRLLGLVLRTLDERQHFGVVAARGLLAGESEIHGGDNQSGLHAIVEIALDARALCLGDIERRGLADLQLRDPPLQLGAAISAEQPADEAPIHDGQTVHHPRRDDEEDDAADERAREDPELGPSVDVGRAGQALDRAPDRCGDAAECDRPEGHRER